MCCFMKPITSLARTFNTVGRSELKNEPRASVPTQFTLPECRIIRHNPPSSAARVLVKRVVSLRVARLPGRSSEGRGTIEPSGRPLVHFHPAAANMTALRHDPRPLLWVFSSRYRFKVELDTDRSLGKRGHIGRRGGN